MPPNKIFPRVYTTDDGWYLLKFLRGYQDARADVLAVFPDATYDYGGYIVEGTRKNAKLIRKEWPGVKWMNKPVGNVIGVKTPYDPDETLTEEQAIKLQNGLYKFQEAGVQFLTERRAAILADDMGLGKTVQAIVTSERVVKRGRRIVVCPSTLVENWIDEIETWTGEDDASIYFILGGSTKKKRLEAIEEVRADDNCWFVISWDVCRMHGLNPVYFVKGKRKTRATSTELWGIQFDIGIADEAHRMKNRKAQQTEAIKKLSIDRRYALTGTPIMNRPDELWSILNWLEPGRFTSYWNFFDDFVDYEDGYFGKVINGAKNVEMLGRLLRTRMIRRTKPEVFKELPDKVYKNLYVPLSKPQQKAYDELTEYFITQLEDGEIVNATQVISQVLRLKQVCVSLGLLSDGVTDSNKIEALVDILHDTEEKVVVFSQFAKAVGLMHKRLIREKIPHVVLTGQHSLIVEADGSRRKTTRGELVKVFQTDEKYRVYIGTTQAGGVGLTLTAAQTVVFMDKMWTPSDQRQAEDRLHRIGQKGSVYVISLLTRGTVEEHIEKRLSSKQGMIQEVMEAATGVREPRAKVDGVEVKLTIKDTRGRISISSVSKLLRRDA